MRLAVISDIHSNKYAMRAVRDEIVSIGAARVLVVGDTFGYYPWAAETFGLLRGLDPVVVKGNHDVLITEKAPPDPEPPYWKAAKQNEGALRGADPGAISWLEGLGCEMVFEAEGVNLRLCHGTPDDPCDGRYYPDDGAEYPWFPGAREVLLLGHTHYPIERRTPAGGLVLNPGSVGQPRDGNPNPSWCVLDTSDLSVTWKRTAYDFMGAAEELERMGWEPRSVAALRKDHKGPLKWP